MNIILTAVDAVASILEVPAGMQLDDSATEPYKVLPAWVYVWPRRLIPQRIDEAGGLPGRWDEADLRVRILYAVAAKGEPRGNHADRAITETLSDATAKIAEEIAANRRFSPIWWDAYVENIVPDAVRSFEVRGYGVDVVLRLIPPAGQGGS